MELLKNILLVSYVKNRGVRRICFVIGIISTLILFLAAIVTGDFLVRSTGFVLLLILFYVPFLIAATVKWITAIYEANKTLSKDDEKSYQVIVEIYMHTTGIIDYCNNAGYLMVRYPELFKQTFANKISFAEQEMKKLNINSPSIYQIDELKTVSYTAWNEQRQMVIANIIMDE